MSDGDGDLDAFIPTLPTPSEISLNNGNAIFVDSGQRLGMNTASHTVLADVDEDGDADAYVSNFSGGPMDQLWINDGLGVFTNSG